MNPKFVYALVLSTLAAFTSVPVHAAAGAVYTLSNATTGNQVLAFSRTADGALTPSGAFSTGGTGTGAGLGNQGALAIDATNRFLFAVNAGSDNVSVFRIGENDLHWVDLAPSGGRHPISLTVNRNVL